MNNYTYWTITKQGSNRVAEAVLHNTKIQILTMVGVVNKYTLQEATQFMAGLYCDPPEGASTSEGSIRLPLEPLAELTAYSVDENYINVEFEYDATNFTNVREYKELTILCRPDLEETATDAYTLFAFAPTYPLSINTTGMQTTTSLSFKIYFPGASDIFTVPET